MNTIAAKYYGLCATCEHDTTCMLRRSSQLQIIQCEEFSIRPVKSTVFHKTGKSEFQDPVEIALPGIYLCSWPHSQSHGILTPSADRSIGRHRDM